MRTIVLLLVLANLTFLGYRWLDSASTGEAIRLAEQVQPEKVRLLTPQQVAALGPSKTDALADVCVEWGPFGDAERNGVLLDLEPLALGRLLTQKRVELVNPFWVYLPAAPNRAEADRRAADLKNRGIREAQVVENGAQRNAISLGIFRTEEAANARVADLAKGGVTGLRTGVRQQSVTLTSLVIRDPPAPAVARLHDLAAAHPNVDFRIGNCDRP
jgi:hypothetical protein